MMTIKHITVQQAHQQQTWVQAGLPVETTAGQAKALDALQKKAAGAADA
jgi:hypothetical protein